jgi:hypothetical protein
VLERERVLHLAQADVGPGVRKHALQTLASGSVALAQRFQPALRFFLQRFECCARTERAARGFSRHAPPSVIA